MFLLDVDILKFYTFYSIIYNIKQIDQTKLLQSRMYKYCEKGKKQTEEKKNSYPGS